jgi:hypothetical protein
MKFWTSATMENCPNEFGWCGSSELMDYEGLGISRDSLNASKLCLTASFNSSTSALSLNEDDCTNNDARPICEVEFAFFFLNFLLLKDVFLSDAKTLHVQTLRMLEIQVSMGG